MNHTHIHTHIHAHAHARSLHFKGGALYKLEGSTAESMTLTGLLRHCEATSTAENDDFPVKLTPCTSGNPAHPRLRKTIVRRAVPEPVGNEALVASWDIDEARTWLYDRELLHTEIMDCDGPALLELDAEALADLGITNREIANKILRAVNEAADRPNIATNANRQQQQQQQQQQAAGALTAGGDFGTARLAIVRQNGVDHAVDASTGQVVRVLSPEEAEKLVARGQQQQLYSYDRVDNGNINLQYQNKKGKGKLDKAKAKTYRQYSTPSTMSATATSSPTSYRQSWPSSHDRFEGSGSHSSESMFAVSGGYKICRANGVVSIVKAGSGRTVHSFALKESKKAFAAVATPAAPASQQSVQQQQHHHHHHHHHHHNGNDTRDHHRRKDGERRIRHPKHSHTHGRRHTAEPEEVIRPAAAVRVGRVVVVEDPANNSSSKRHRRRGKHKRQHQINRAVNAFPARFSPLQQNDPDFDFGHGTSDNVGAAAKGTAVAADDVMVDAMMGGGAYNDLAETLTHSMQEDAFAEYGNDADISAATASAILPNNYEQPVAIDDSIVAVNGDVSDGGHGDSDDSVDELPPFGDVAYSVSTTADGGRDIVVDGLDSQPVAPASPPPSPNTLAGIGNGHGNSSNETANDSPVDLNSGDANDSHDNRNEGEAAATGFPVAPTSPTSPTSPTLIKIGSGSIIENFLSRTPSPQPQATPFYSIADGNGSSVADGADYYDSATLIALQGSHADSASSGSSGPIIYARAIDTPPQSDSVKSKENNADGSGIYDIANAPDSPDVFYDVAGKIAHTTAHEDASNRPVGGEDEPYTNSFGMVVAGGDGSDGGGEWQEAV